jgi:hypothetical protein
MGTRTSERSRPPGPPELKLTEEEACTLDAYERHAEVWAGRHGGDDLWKPELQLFRDLAPSGRVLDVGSGAGRERSTPLKPRI